MSPQLPWVLAEGHRADVFVRFEDGSIRRPLVFFWVDPSHKVLSWSVGEAERSHAALVTTHGAPAVVVLDNGNAHTAPLAVLCERSGSRVQFTKLRSARSKPIESVGRNLEEAARARLAGRSPVSLAEFWEAIEGAVQHAEPSPDLSGALVRVARVIGIEETLRLAEGMKDTVRVVPQNPQRARAWLQYISQESVEKLCAELAGQRIAFPLTPAHGGKKRQILELSERGLSPTAIGRLVGCTVKYVKDVVRDGGAE